ncbi:hypothetical protein [Mycolicibacterium iranicum]|uniref:Glyoxalase n=1 Tax=Mycolicibacterium iranicum TaxID=912594 RepID=A0ABT4H8I5_MYCIR|nr:hypothetical protein [Mycolicibacterium iranicum]MCZ0726501.1 hypothetical protein [Mycolicibacterium iranicum]
MEQRISLITLGVDDLARARRFYEEGLGRGGYSGYFADPDGHVWEVALNPEWTINADGTLTLQSRRD